MSAVMQLSRVVTEAGAVSADAALLERIDQRIAATGLDLHGLTVITEAATGAYRATAAIAARAGARRVIALARNTARHGTAADAARATIGLAAMAGAANRIEGVGAIEPEMLGGCDILTNSGHLRPITATMIGRLPPGAVIALMFEAWEFRAGDLDLAACAAAGVRVAAVNERHPSTGVFDFLGPLAVRLLEDSGTVVADARVALLCDSPFAPFIAAGLGAAGASVETFAEVGQLYRDAWRAVVVALTPGALPRLPAAAIHHLARTAPLAILAQFWGDIDREAAQHYGFSLWPPTAPGRGHMGILLNALGDEPIVRLQTGGLKAAEFIHRGGVASSGAIAELVTIEPRTRPRIQTSDVARASQ
jgi:hypothetical protein